MDVLVGQSKGTNESRPRLKYSRKISSNDKNHRERKWAKKKDDTTWGYGNSKRVFDIIDF